MKLHPCLLITLSSGVLCVLVTATPSDAPSGRIFFGRNADEGQFPYQALLLSPRNNETYLLCGGSLIAAEWVLTAAHCLEEGFEMYVFLGVIDRVTRDQFNSTGDIMPHPDYSDYTGSNDIGLVRLHNPAPVDGKLISTIKLPTSDYRNPKKVNNKFLCAAGWGDIDDVRGPPRKLRYQRLHVKPHTLCQILSIFFGIIITDQNICTDKLIFSGVCPGDSGGPLAMCPGSDCQRCSEEATLIGISSFIWSTICVNPLPSSYTNVGYFLPWITNTTGIQAP